MNVIWIVVCLFVWVFVCLFGWSVDGLGGVWLFESLSDRWIGCVFFYSWLVQFLSGLVVCTVRTRKL